MSDKIQHKGTSRNSLYQEMDLSLDSVYKIWRNGDENLRLAIPVLAAAKLEAFINIAGTLKSKHWDILERKLSFKEKCQVVFAEVNLKFDHGVEPNKTVLDIFQTRNALVHPNAKVRQIAENLSKGEGERRTGNKYSDREPHHMHAELTSERISQFKNACAEFVSRWERQLLGKHSTCGRKRDAKNTDLKRLSDFLRKTPAFKGVVGAGAKDGLWWIWFMMDTRHDLAWHVVHEYSHVLNATPNEKSSPSIFMPMSRALHMNSGIKSLTWVIKSTSPEFTPDFCAGLLEGRLPRPVDDISQWNTDDDE